ncbi:MAG: ABC transporter permease [Bacillota bacterium]|jgi:ABC-2 type transport system permease protein|nr:ABC transporter permease [Thermoanaerobacteraceae bacterium]
MQGFLAAVYIIWLRDVKRFLREGTRILAMLGQPVLYLLIMGQGLRATFRVNIAGFDYLEFVYPGVIGMSVLFTAIFSAVSIIWDRQFGFLKEVLVAPVPRAAIAMGKALGGSTTASMQGLILLILAPLAGVSLGPEQVLAIAGLMFVMAFAVASIGTLVAARMETMEGFHLVTNFLTLPMFLLSGAFFPLKTAPAWMQPLMRLDPVYYGVDALRNVIFAGSPLKSFVVGQTLTGDLLVLFCFSLVMTGLGMLAFSRTE